MTDWFEKRRDLRADVARRRIANAWALGLFVAGILSTLFCVWRIGQLEQRVAQLEHQVRILDVGVMDHGDQIYGAKP